MEFGKDIILIKLGGSVITDKNAEKKADLPTITLLSKEIREARTVLKSSLIIAHGAGSYGHPQAKKYGTANGFLDEVGKLGMTQVRKAVTQLNALVVDHLLIENIPAVSLSPNTFLTTKNKKLEHLFLHPLINHLTFGVVPVIHGDVLTDREIGSTIYSGETVLNLLAGELRKFGFNPIKIIEVGKSDGVYNPEGETVPIINSQNYKEIETYLAGSESIDVTGGMAHKVEEAYLLAKDYSIPTLLISAKPGNLKKAILGEEVLGTWIKI